MSLHLPTLDTDRMDVHATPDGRVHVYIGGHCALLPHHLLAHRRVGRHG